MSGSEPRCDLFCTVIDNYGDLGVCWRLARQLAAEHGVAVTLWVDDLVSFAHLAPALDATREDQMLGDIRLRRWRPGAEADLAGHAPADLVIEGFACRLPEGYLAAMAAREPAPVWVNLEYLSAEDWVAGCHGMTSTHPRNGLVQRFCFPGFTPGTGGLLREAGLCDRLDALRGDAVARRDFWRRIGVAQAADRRLSLFSYENPALPGLLDALAADTTPTLLLVFTGRSLPGVAAWLGQPLSTGDRARRGMLDIHVLPLLDHVDYDRLLALCDLNLVRGEDSFVRAQWAGRPLLWHIYGQEAAAHLIKLDAWIRHVDTIAMPPAAWAQAMRAWNQSATPDWPSLLAALPSLQASAGVWRAHLLRQDDLATQLMRFYADQVESAPVPKHPRNP